MTEPLTPPDCDLRDFPFMPLEVRRLLNSETWVLGTAEEKVAALQLWCEAWHQTPAGSLPDNERMLAHLSGAGASWSTVREQAMRGWVKCTDGRLYHAVVAEKVNESWMRKQAQRQRSRKGHAARWGGVVQQAPGRDAQGMPEASLKDASGMLQASLGDALGIPGASPGHASSMPQAMPDACLTNAKGQGQGEREGEGEGKERKKEPPLPPSPSGNGGEDASQSELKAGGRPDNWAGQHRGLRANKTNPRAQAEAIVALLAAAPEPDHPLWPELRLMAVDASQFRKWIVPLVQAEDDDGRAVFIAPSAFHAHFVRTQFEVQLARALRRPVELRSEPPAPRAPPPAASPGPVKPPRKRSTPAPVGQLMPQELGAGISIANGNSHAIGPESGGNAHHLGPDGNA